MLFLRKKTIFGCEERGDVESPYLTRLALFGCRWFQLCVHTFHRSDNEEEHDHPWDFWTLILRHGYYEICDSQVRRLYPGQVLYRQAEHRHRVLVLDEGRLPVTLCLMFRRRREWGFFTSAGYQNWREYFHAKGCVTEQKR